MTNNLTDPLVRLRIEVPRVAANPDEAAPPVGGGGGAGERDVTLLSNHYVLACLPTVS